MEWNEFIEVMLKVKEMSKNNWYYQKSNNQKSIIMFHEEYGYTYLDNFKQLKEFVEKY